ncbi:kelch-like protein 40 isoform X2 [Biomphalaria glabrata]|uniref:Kelch-like protein 40 isoform X2 n=1 Tax=Biomphalaria glabrata TaxID=6526 RepID=A0A9W2Z8Z3_BIOGL|nr:kelch-like protein 40 isoform X2 [Biomphalaria glabrata]
MSFKGYEDFKRYDSKLVLYLQKKSEIKEQKPEIRKKIPNKIKSKIEKGVMHSWSHVFARDKFCDFTIFIGDVEFPCHRFVINACSKFFEALLRSDIKEIIKVSTTVHGISEDIFRLVLGVMYGDSSALTAESMTGVWKAAHKLQIDFLMSACEDFILENMNIKDCFSIYADAHLLQSQKVLKSVLNFMTENFASVAKSENFGELLYEDFVNILLMKNVSVSVDFQIESILKWCVPSKSDDTQGSECRVSKLSNLLQVIQMSKMSKKCLASLLTNKLVQEDTAAVALVNAQAAKKVLECDYDSHRRSQDFFSEGFGEDIDISPLLSPSPHPPKRKQK